MRQSNEGRALLMDNQTDSGVTLLAKIAGVWGVIGITSWSEAASFAAFVYTMWLIASKFWRDILRPLCVQRGWVQALPSNAKVADDEPAI